MCWHQLPNLLLYQTTSIDITDCVLAVALLLALLLVHDKRGFCLGVLNCKIKWSSQPETSRTRYKFGR